MNPLNRRQMLGMTPLLALGTVPVPKAPIPAPDLVGGLIALRGQSFHITAENYERALEAGIELHKLIKVLELDAHVFDDFTECWYRNGLLHRADGPALIAEDSRFWYANGELHRADGPAIEGPNGGQQWYLDGLAHREGGPAVELADGSKRWLRNGRLHRLDGPATEDADGTKYWYEDGQFLRREGPQVEILKSARRWRDRDRTDNTNPETP